LKEARMSFRDFAGICDTKSTNSSYVLGKSEISVYAGLDERYSFFEVGQRITMINEG